MRPLSFSTLSPNVNVRGIVNTETNTEEIFLSTMFESVTRDIYPTAADKNNFIYYAQRDVLLFIIRDYGKSCIKNLSETFR